MIPFERFYKIYESKELSFQIPYIIGEKYTTGRHSFGDSPEIPASDPRKSIEPKIIYDAQKLSEILKQYDCKILRVIYERYEWGSYHERQLYCNAHLVMSEANDIDDNENMMSDIENVKIEDDYYYPLTGPGSYVRSRGLTTETLPFTSFKDILKNWKEMVDSSEITTPQGSSEDFWDKKISNVMMMHKHNNREYGGD
jgi:hypothetical protein